MFARTLVAVVMLAGVARAEDAKAPSAADIDKAAARSAYDAAKLGSELWTAGNLEGCFRLYQGTLMALQPMLAHRPKLAELVKSRLDEAKDLRAEKGAFVLRDALDAIQKETATPAPPINKKGPLWDRLGGEKVVRAVVHDFVAAMVKDPKVNFSRNGRFKLTDKALAQIEEHLMELVSEVGRGPLEYTGGDVKKTHAGMRITDAEFEAAMGHLGDALKKNKVPQAESDELLKFLGSVKSSFVAE
jgi:hemoglobin